MPPNKATAISTSNIAFIKYWGNHDAHLRLPLNDSISMNLAALTTTTTVEFDAHREQDEVIIDGAPAPEAAAKRVVAHLDRVRALARISDHAHVVSRNTFPQGSGLASSASAFAALSAAAAHAAGLELSERELSILARQGSGSAARSIPPGYVEWIAARSSDDSYARMIAPPEHWALRDVVVIVTDQAKLVSSTEGHLRSVSSPFLSERLNRLPIRFHHVRRALRAKDLAALGPDLEAEALELHCIAMTSRPPIFYWTPATLRVMQAAMAWRHEGLNSYFTLDAGANVHLICAEEASEEVARSARALPEVKDVIVSGPGPGTVLVEEHLA